MIWREITMNKIESIRLWENRIKSRKLSGMDVNEWCGKNNISRNAYYYWHRKIKDFKEEPSPVFAEVLIEPKSIIPVEKISKPEIIITWKEFSITFKDMDVVSIVAELLSKLEEQC